ncbi:hypothetical protein PILCRDRAFT_378475 [Piloderma croceum F 1598]|uniref:Uncharacterized protein n=1 Tax=Piloderma croceum (strain F 1598) TaxID=765440 RepID=A0A0C3C5S6_PILCF|nr:hypothetical protein PILCRDRAFT_378475 [Piloderma croceum F 1598]
MSSIKSINPTDFDFELSSTDGSPRPRVPKKRKFAKVAEKSSAPKPASDSNAKPTAKVPKKSLPPKADTPKFTKPAIDMLIKHCERISYDNMQIQAAIVKTQLKSDRLRIAAARLENDTITKKVEALRLEAELLLRNGVE